MFKSDLFYNIDSNKIIDKKLDRNKKFNRLIRLNNEFNEDNINELSNIISTCNCYNDVLSLIKCIDFNLLYPLSNLLITYLTLITKLTSFSDIAGIDEVKYLVNDILTKIENLFNNNPSLYDIEKYNLMLNNIGHYSNTIERIVDGITTDYVYYLSPKEKNNITNINTNESINSELYDDSRAVSSNNIPQDISSSECINKIINCDNDYDVFVHNIKYLYVYLVSLNGNFNDTNSKIFVDTLNYAFSKIINDITAKEIMIDTLSKCDELLTNSIGDSIYYKENIEIMISIIDKITDHINEYPSGTTSLIDEMGLGYFYECPNNINEATVYLNECAEKYNMLSVINESILDRAKKFKDKMVQRHDKNVEYRDKKYNEKHEFFDDTKDTRRDIYDKKQTDEYETDKDQKQINRDFKNQKRQDRYNDNREFKNEIRDDTYSDVRRNIDERHDFKQQKKQDKYDFKQQKKQDKYDFKRQKKLDKWEQKKSGVEYNRELNEQKRQERLEARQRKRDETKIGINKWKTLELTNANVYKAVNALKKCVKAGAAGGVAALAGLNPIFAGSTYLLKEYRHDKNHPIEQSQKYAEDIKLQIADIDEKISAADARGETDKRIALAKMKKKLQIAYNSINPVAKFKTDQIPD